jgi:hypothetical protein
MAQRAERTANLLERFLGMSVRWLCAGDESRPVRVDVASATLYQGEPVKFFGQVYDAAFRPVDNARLRVTVRGAASGNTVDLRSTGSGRYEGTLEGLAAGTYTYTSEAEADGVRYGDDEGRFTVGGITLEFQDTRMNTQTLREIAGATGGKSATFAGADSLLFSLRENQTLAGRQEESTDTVTFRHWPYSLATLLLLLSAEWVFRKRLGMV